MSVIFHHLPKDVYSPIHRWFSSPVVNIFLRLCSALAIFLTQCNDSGLFVNKPISILPLFNTFLKVLYSSIHHWFSSPVV